MHEKAVFIAFLSLLCGCIAQPAAPGAYGSAHEHADFRVYANGAPIDFSQEKYQSPLPPGGDDSDCGNSTLLAHLHNGDGDVVHKHATGVTWGYFFSSLGMNWSGSCLSIGNGTAYCDSGQAKWRFFLNGSEVPRPAGVEIRDLDRALFTYNATGPQIAQQLASVTSKSAQESTGGSCLPSNPRGHNAT